jgi:hypothetical protein
MKCLFASVGILIVFFSQAQNKVLLQVPVSGKTITDFIPAEYDTLVTASGDLNKDKSSDYAIVLKSKKEETFDPSINDSDSLPSRLLIILFKSDKGYRLAGKTDKLIMCSQCGGIFGDPFEGIEIVNGILTVNHYGGSAWRWSYTHKFRYQQNDFYLIGQTNHSYWNVKNCDKLGDFAGTEYKDVNFVTGGYEEKKISEDCKLVKNKKGKQKIQPLIKLSAFTIDN